MDFPYSVEYLHKSNKAHIKKHMAPKPLGQCAAQMKHSYFILMTDGSIFLHNYLKFLKAVKDTWQTLKPSMGNCSQTWLVWDLLSWCLHTSTFWKEERWEQMNIRKASAFNSISLYPANKIPHSLSLLFPPYHFCAKKAKSGNIG